MAINFTPLTAYLDSRVKDSNEVNRNSIGNLGGAVGAVAALYNNYRNGKNYAKTREDFFNSLGDKEIQQDQATIDEMDVQISEKLEELKALEAEDGV